MTAIAGYWDYRGGTDATSAAERMLQALSIYSPGKPVCLMLDGLAVGRRLSALVPEDRYDREPVSGRDGSLLLAADVRLTNRPELVQALGLNAERARMLADSQLVARAWEKWSEAALQRIYGPFALAIGDLRTRTVILARDPVGERPLYYHRGRGFLAFASMPKGLLALEQIPRQPSRATAAAFISLLSEAQMGSFFEGIDRVPPGHIVRITEKRVDVSRWWEPNLEPFSWQSHEQCVEAARVELDLAVERSLRGVNGRVASHLSAGLDSTAVTATAARQLQNSGGHVLALTAVPRTGFVPRKLQRIEDEGPLASLVAAQFDNVEHIKVNCDEWSPMREFERDQVIYDQPVPNVLNNGWFAAINDVVQRRGFKVLLTGTMGNLSFSHSGVELLPQLLASGRWMRLAQEVSRNRRLMGSRWSRAIAPAIMPFLPAIAQRRISGLNRDWRAAFQTTLANPALLDDAAFASSLSAAADRFTPWIRDGGAARLQALRSYDCGNYTKGLAGGWGIDLRDPTADRRLVEFTLRIGAEHFFRKGVPRSLARDMLADRLPPELLAERRKGLQSADRAERVELVKAEVVELTARLVDGALVDSFVDVQKLQSLISNWPAGGDWAEEGTEAAYSSALMKALAIGHFYTCASGVNR